jgi:peptidoglycan hydrolase CwlO-like protein
MISTILIIILSVLVVILGYTTFNLLRKNEKAEDLILKYEKYIQELDQNVQFITKRIDEIDQKGTFKSDDEVGFFFERLKMLNDLLKQFKI